MHRFIFRLIPFLLLLPVVMALGTTIARAHVSADDMPDSVAEMEYAIFLEFKPDDLVVRNKLGMVYYRLKKLPEAVKEFTTVLHQDPRNYDALDGMGLVKAAQHDYDAAISYHQQAIGINSNDMAGYYHLGIVLEMEGRQSEALEAYRASLAKFEQQYPAGSDKKSIKEFGEKVRTAIRTLEAK